MKAMILDLEVENNEWYSHKASLLNPDNYIVMAGWRIDDFDGTDGEVQYVYHESKEIADNSDWFRIPDDVGVLVAHNAMYELSCLLNRHRYELEKFLRRGGRVFCTQLAEYVLSNFVDLYPALTDVAVRYGGTHKIDAVKVLWDSGKKTSEIDRGLLYEYLCSDEGDVVNTAKVFWGQLQLLQERGQMQMYWDRADGMLGFAYCEYFGLHVNTEVAYKNLEKQTARAEELANELEKLLPNLPSDFSFNWGSSYHLSALLYGGAIKYETKVPYTPTRYVKQDVYKLTGGSYVAVTDDVPEGVVTYARGKYQGLPKVYRIDTDVELMKMGSKVYKFDGLVNIKTLPKEIRSMFEGNGEFISKRRLLCGTPVYSTSESAMDVVKNYVPEVKLYAELASIRKDIGTYYIKDITNKDGTVVSRTGMLSHVGQDNIVHHRLNITATKTGRLSSSNPNLQNIPRGDTSDVKEMFNSRYGGNGRIVEVDYSALEVVMGCAITGDTKLLSMLKDDIDMHCYRLAYSLQQDYDYVHNLACIDESAPTHKEYKNKRTAIKRTSFASQYGAKAHGLVYATGCTLDFAEKFLKNEQELFPMSINFRAVVRAEVERTGELAPRIREQTSDGRYVLYRRGYFSAPSTTRYSFRQKYQWEGGKEVLDYKDTEIANYWCQGEAGFLMTTATGRVIRWLLAMNFFDGKVCLINNVHDALYLDVAYEELAIDVARIVRNIMQDTPKYILPHYNYAIHDVPFPAVAEIGINMKDKYRV